MIIKNKTKKEKENEDGGHSSIIELHKKNDHKNRKYKENNNIIELNKFITIIIYYNT